MDKQLQWFILDLGMHQLIILQKQYVFVTISLLSYALQSNFFPFCTKKWIFPPFLKLQWQNIFGG